MAYSTSHHFSFLFFMVLLAFPCNIRAIREGKVFAPSPSPIVPQISLAPASPSPVVSGPAPTPSEPVESGPEPTPFEIAPSPLFDPVESDNAYGLYGRRDFDDRIFSKKTGQSATGTPIDSIDDLNDKDEVPTVDFEAENLREFNSNNNNYVNNYNNNNGYLTSTYYKNEYTNGYNGNSDVERQGMSDTRFMENGNKYNNNNGYSTTNYYKNEYTNGYNGNSNVERQGMSDTRFMENGKYYYDANKNENKNKVNNYGYASENNNGSGHYFGERSKYEFDSMEEYDRQQGYTNSQREYVP